MQTTISSNRNGNTNPIIFHPGKIENRFKLTLAEWKRQSAIAEEDRHFLDRVAKEQSGIDALIAQLGLNDEDEVDAEAPTLPRETMATWLDQYQAAQWQDAEAVAIP